MKRLAKRQVRIIERYGISPEGFPVAEIAHWQAAKEGDPVARAIPGMQGLWVLLAVENPLAHISLYERYGVLNPETGFKELVIPDDAEYWDYYACPIKPGYTLEYNRDVFIAKLKQWNKRIKLGDYAAYSTARAVAQFEYERLIGDQWSPELASRLSGYTPKGTPNAVPFDTITAN